MTGRDMVNLVKVGLDASTACQLKCPSCPTASGEVGEALGRSHLSLENFRRFVDQNPRVAQIEMSNWGEFMLNPELLGIMEYAYRKNVGLYAYNGVNLNHAPEQVLEGLARWKFRALNCSIDGAGQGTYGRYRVGGDFDRVIGHVRAINRFKARHKTRYPKLTWQFVIFGHNEHEVETARAMARDLGMAFKAKLAWEDLYDKPFSPIRDRARVRASTEHEAADREEYRQKHQRDYVSGCCVGMWNAVRINHDGRLLGCSVNYWGDYGNVFTQGLEAAVQSEAMQYAREMLMGRKPARAGVPCTTCKVYKNIADHQLWISPEQIAPMAATRKRLHYRIQNKVLGERATDVALNLAGTIKARLGTLRRGARSPEKLSTGVRPLPVPFPLEGSLWRSAGQFAGRTAAAAHLTVHTSALAPGHRPHPPHVHEDEELLLMLRGDADLLLPDHPGESRHRMSAGEFAYYPPGFRHSLEAVGEVPAVYTMFKWRGASIVGPDLDFARERMTPPVPPGNGGKRTSLVFEGPTRFLTKLRAHATVLPPGAGYAPHRDPYDVAVVLLEGSVMTLGERMEAPAVAFYRAGEPHGMKNPEDVPARYLVFEFHPGGFHPGLAALRGLRRRPPRVLGGLTRILRS